MKLYEALEHEEKDGKKLAEIASGMVNDISGRARKELDAILTDLNIRSAFVRMSVAYVLSLNAMNSKWLYDGRNECACKTAAGLVKCPLWYIYREYTVATGIIPADYSSIKQWILVKGGEPHWEEVFAYYMAGEHRTLQQAFAGLAFTAIRESMAYMGKAEEIDAYMESNGFYDWTHMPFI